MSALTVAEKVRMALAEAGYPDALVRSLPDGDAEVVLLPSEGGVPDEVCWQAFALASHAEQPCRRCWGDGDEDNCLAIGQRSIDCRRVR